MFQPATILATLTLVLTGASERCSRSAYSLLRLTISLIFCSGVICGNSYAQGPGAGGEGGAPAFTEPKFEDKMWEAGGPRLSGLHAGKMVTAIEIVGNQTVSKHKILSHMQTRTDRVYDEKQLQLDIHELYRTDLFRRINPSIAEQEDGIVLRLEVQEQPTITAVIFHGNTRLEDKMLKKHCGISEGDPVNPFSVDMARQRLLDLYSEKGMNQTAIVVREGNQAGDRRVFFEISEGLVERIWDIDFVGNELFSDAVLKTKISSKDARNGVTAYIMNVANTNKIKEDAQKLLAFYRSLGYFNARVDHRIDYAGDHNKLEANFVNVTFVVDEGPQFKVRNISVVGNTYPAFTTELLLNSMEMKPGEPFNLGKMNRDKRTLRNDFYGREGFVFVDIVPQPVFLEEPATLDLVYKINEGDQYRAGDINVFIEGDSSHTKRNVVINRMDIRPGELIDLRELENAQRRLGASQIFETNPSMGEPPRVEVRPPDREESEDF